MMKILFIFLACLPFLLSKPAPSHFHSPNDDPEINNLSAQVAVELELQLVLTKHLLGTSKENVKLHNRILSLVLNLNAYFKAFYAPQVLKLFIPNVHKDLVPSDWLSIEEYVLNAYRRHVSAPWAIKFHLTAFDSAALPEKLKSSYCMNDFMGILRFMPGIAEIITATPSIFAPVKFTRTRVRTCMARLIIQQVKSMIIEKIEKDFDIVDRESTRFYESLWKNFTCSTFYLSAPLQLDTAKEAYINLPTMKFNRVNTE
jgi:hypothetical protein